MNAKLARFQSAIACIVLALSSFMLEAQESLAMPTNIRIMPRHLRIDLAWSRTNADEYEVQRTTSPDDPFETLANPMPSYPVFTDFLGKSDGDYVYRVRGIRRDKDGHITATSPWSPMVKETPRRDQPEELVTEIQEASFRYFYEGGHPISGLALERSKRTPDCCAIGATGMGLFTIGVGIERGFVSRKAGAERVLQIVRFLSEKAERFHGAFSHQLNGVTGKVIPFSTFDDGADLVETAFLAEGLLFLREFFTGTDAIEAEIRQRSDQIWRGIEWDFFTKEDQKYGACLYWHWSPNVGWKKGLPIRGFNECQIVYLLAMASPTHPIDLKFYQNGWDNSQYRQDRTSFEIPLQMGRDLGGPLFYTQYSYMGFDPHKISYGGRNYFEHFQDQCRVQIKYADSRKDDFVGYGPIWGITSSLNPKGYKAHAPGPKDDGTIAPTAALSSMPYVPVESRACMIEMYEKYGSKLWGPFGFYDAFNLSKEWVGQSYLGIDVGPVAPMIENQRTGLCWNTFMKAPELDKMLKFLAQPSPAQVLLAIKPPVLSTVEAK